jgi:hypothetical protein
MPSKRRKQRTVVETSDHDIVWGVRSIAATINRSQHQTYYLIRQGLLPIKKHSHKMISASRAQLREWCLGNAA